MTDFEIIREMRNSVVYDKMDFRDFLYNYTGDLGEKRLGALWCKALKVVKEDKWKAYLLNHVATTMIDLSNRINDLYSEGLSESEISTMCGINLPMVKEMLVTE